MDIKTMICSTTIPFLLQSTSITENTENIPLRNSGDIVTSEIKFSRELNSDAPLVASLYWEIAIDSTVNETDVSRNSAQNSIPLNVENRIEKLKSAYNGLNQNIFDISTTIIGELFKKGLNPIFINILEEESLSLASEYYTDRFFYLVEVFEDGDIVFLKRDLKSKKREAIDLTHQNFSKNLNFFDH